MRRWLREPLLHFALLGALLFALYGWINRGLAHAPRQIVVTSGQLDHLRAQFARTWQRPPTPDELNGLVEQWIRDEIYYREGQALGLDRDDPVVRRRIAQKMEFIADGLEPAPPTEAELQAWLDAHRDRYAIEPVYSLQQVYFDPARRGERLDADLRAARAALQRGEAVDGDATLLPEALDAAPGFEVVRVFGKQFAESLTALPVGSWSEPLRSAFGLHLVRLVQRSEGRSPALAEVRTEVERDLLQSRSARAKEDFYRKLRAGYRVRIDSAAASAAAPGG